MTKVFLCTARRTPNGRYGGDLATPRADAIAKPDPAFMQSPQMFASTIGLRFVNVRSAASYGSQSMPKKPENAAADRGISRVDQDTYACRSQMGYTATRHAADSLPVTQTGQNGGSTVITADQHPRSTSLEKLAAPFCAGGPVTASTSANINDGACAMILASAAGITRSGLVRIARLGAASSGAAAPRVMAQAPNAAVARLCTQTGLTPTAFDTAVLNKTFATQVLACTRAWGLPDDAAHANAQGGSIATGHPLGVSGARTVATAARRLFETGGKTALATLCLSVGVGQGVALAVHSL